MPKFTRNDISGKRFGSLLAIRFVPDDSAYAKFLFMCDCGIEKIIMAQSVIRGATVSCGCVGSADRSKKLTIHGHGKSGKNRNPTYSSWASMMTRCEWGNHSTFDKYGAVGIKVFHEWHNFENFLRDMGERPIGTSIDRIDNMKGYFPGNCRWATRHEQALNTSRTVKVVIDGKLTIVYDLCDKLGLSRKAVRARAVRRGYDYVSALRSFGIECEACGAQQGVKFSAPKWVDA